MLLVEYRYGHKLARDWTEGFVVAEQQSLLFQGASDASGDGVEQALEFRLGRGGDTVEAGPFIFERVDAVDDEHVQVDVERQPR